MQLNSTKYYALLLCCLSTYSLSAKDGGLSDVQHNLSRNSTGFVENKGQVTNQYHKVRTDIQYNLKRDGVSMFLAPGSIHYQFNNISGKDKSFKDHAYRMDVMLVGANTHAKAIAGDDQTYTEQYNVNGKMVTAKSFDKITYVDVYPGIDWVVYTKNGKVEYDFVVRPGADANKIQLKYGGAKSISLTENGGLAVNTPSGTIAENTPYTYTLNTKQTVTSSYVLNGNTLSFNVASHEGAIVIDPQVQWSTYYGGANAEFEISVTTDAVGNVYTGGYTTSTANIATTGAYQTVYNANTDGTLVKFNANGTIAWSTYFGGPGTDNVNGVGIDPNGNVYITGSTNSTTGISTSSSFQPTYGGGGDAFLAKFTSAGALLWSTYFGGTGNDITYSVVCDKGRSVYIGGASGSTSGVATAGAFNTTESGTLDGFIARFDTAGNRLWATYYGSGVFTNTYVTALSLDPAGALYFTGETNAAAGIATTSAYQPAQVGLFSFNAFVGKFDSVGNRHWCSYYGAGNTYGFAIANNAFSSLYIGGYTTGSTNIASANAYQAAFGGGVQDGYLAKFDTAGNFKWGTYYGGAGSETQKGIAVDNFGNPMITGFTTSTTGIATTNNGTYQSTIGGGQDGYIAKFTPLGQRMWGTYFGGSLTETQSTMASNANGSFYIAGYSASSNAIATAGAYQTINNGNTDGYIARFNTDTFVVISQPYTDTIICPAGSFNINYTTSYAFNAGNVFTAQLSDATGSFAAPVAIGNVTAVGTTGVIPVNIPANTAAGTGYRIRIVATSPAYTSPDEYVNIHIISSLAQPTITSNSPVCVGDSIKLTATNTSIVMPTALNITGPAGFSSGSGTGLIAFANTINAGTYTASVTHNGCPAATASVNVAVNNITPATPTATSNTPICSGNPIIIHASSTSSPVTYRITGPHGYVSSSQNPVIANADTTMAGYYFIVDTLGGCRSAKDSILVSVSQSITTTLTVVATPGDTVCSGSGFSFTAIATNAGNNPQYQWRIHDVILGDTAVVGAISNIYGSAFLNSGDSVYCILHSNAQCLSNPADTSNKVKITILQPSTPVVSIAVSPSNTVAQGTALTFTSTVTLGGTNTSYQWYVNGHAVANDTLSSATFHSLADSDVVTLIVHNHVMCANPDSAISNAIRVHITTGISNVEAALNTINLYPNPNNGVMSLTGHLQGLTSNSVQLEILNAIGQLVYTNTVGINNGTLNGAVKIGSNIADGTYLLRIKADGESRVIRFTVQR
ncbi:MAG: SBBP repeat-containing protein [Flavipsychrobacter sp.]|nr:SBBP repeat-containing protein [Flavipsychrobacter sp.]